MLKRRAASYGVNLEIHGPQKKEEKKKKNQVLINKKLEGLQWFSHGVKHRWLVLFTLGIPGVRESVGT